VVSALHRFSDTYFDAVQVDVAVNRGNSGGPLINLAGKVVGINGKIETRFETGINTGVGYAIPANQIRRFLEPLRRAEGGRVNHGTILGLEVAERGEEGKGIEITGVARGSLAEKLGLQKGDRLLELAGLAVRTRSRFRGILGTYPAGEEIALRVGRGAERLEIKAPIVESGPAFLGVDTVAPEGTESGARVVRVYPGTAAYRSGLLPEDIIQSFNGEKVQSVLDLARLIQSRAAGDLVKVTVSRSGSSVELDLRLRGRGEGAK
jgi:S1-C subfamily serine protease